METLPHTRTGLAAELAAIGITPGMTLIVHTSLSQVGWVVGGANTLIWALMDTLGPQGTLAMPSFTGQLSDPATWQQPAVAEAWIPIIRANMPPYDPARTPTRQMGSVAEQFRTWPDVHRSPHPLMSMAAWGRHARDVTAPHDFAYALGDSGPMGRLNALDARVLLIGVGYNRNSSLHLAESRAAHGRRQQRMTPVAEGDGVAWKLFDEVGFDQGVYFPRIGADFEAAGGVSFGRLGDAETRLMPQRALVDFAIAWLDHEMAEPVA